MHNDILTSVNEYKLLKYESTCVYTLLVFKWFLVKIILHKNKCFAWKEKNTRGIN